MNGSDTSGLIEDNPPPDGYDPLAKFQEGRKYLRKWMRIADEHPKAVPIDPNKKFPIPNHPPYPLKYQKITPQERIT